MCGPIFNSYEEDWIAMEAMSDDEQWAEWEKAAAELEITLDYYLAEFV